MLCHNKKCIVIVCNREKRSISDLCEIPEERLPLVNRLDFSAVEIRGHHSSSGRGRDDGRQRGLAGTAAAEPPSRGGCVINCRRFRLRSRRGNGAFAEFPGANPTIVSYSASAVNIYDATSSLVRFENIFFNFFHFEKPSSLIQ
jgi:hypothetical protein